MIRSFKCTETELIFWMQKSRKFPPDIQQVALRKLRIIHRATSIFDLRAPPANRLERLHGNRDGQWRIRINDQWRICFKWEQGDAFSVEIVGYH